MTLCGYYFSIVGNPRVILIDSFFHRERTCGLKPMVCDDVISTWKKVCSFIHLNKLESPTLMDALCQVWLKLNE